jgi:spore coat protein U-like protein
MMNGLKSTLATASLLALLSHGAAQATTSITDTVNITATIAASCAISSVAAVNFGTNYNPSNTSATYADGSITIACVKGTHPTIALSSGNNPDAVTGARRMAHASIAGEVLAYSLFKPAGTGFSCSHTETEAWGASGLDVFDPGVAGGLASTTISICGKIDAGQDVSTGSYSDQVIATVTF